MLSRLHINNYALIDTLDIQFDAGLNIITGETGAGKSIIMGALSLILGNRMDGKYFFNQQLKCIIEGYFSIASYDLKPFFKEHDLDYEAETIIRREITPEGKSRAFINDSPVTLQVLKALGERLIDVHSQHATQQINTEDFQLLVIDSVANNGTLKSDYRTVFKDYRATLLQLKKLKEAILKANAEADYHQFIVDELVAAGLKEEEQKLLEEEQRQLENAEVIKTGLLASVYALDEQEVSAVQSIKEAIGQLHQVAEYTPPLVEMSARLNSVYIEIKDIIQELATIEQTVVLDESRLTVVNERLSQLYSLQKKHRVESVDELIALRNQLAERLRAVSDQETDLLALEQQLKQQEQDLQQAAVKLHASREQVLETIQDYIASILQEVGMPNANLFIALNLLEPEAYKESGADQVQFLFSANKGQELQPMHKVASGGELSRVMLAIKSLIAERSALPTIIFDEIDTGISGEVALKVGEVMQRLAKNMQVMAITHLPQIASKGSTHFKVYKKDVGDKTMSNIVLLNPEDRIVEVAQMLSGAKPGESALQHARDLIEA